MDQDVEPSPKPQSQLLHPPPQQLRRLKRPARRHRPAGFVAMDSAGTSASDSFPAGPGGREGHGKNMVGGESATDGQAQGTPGGSRARCVVGDPRRTTIGPVHDAYTHMHADTHKHRKVDAAAWCT